MYPSLTSFIIKLFEDETFPHLNHQILQVVDQIFQDNLQALTQASVFGQDILLFPLLSTLIPVVVHLQEELILIDSFLKLCRD